MFDCERLYEYNMNQLCMADTVIVLEKKKMICYWKPACLFYFLEQVRLKIFTQCLLFLVTKCIYVEIRPTRAKDTSNTKIVFDFRISSYTG